MTARPHPSRSADLRASRALLARAGGLLVAAVAAFITLRSFDLGAVAATLERAHPTLLLVAVGVVLLQLLVRAARLRVLLPAPDDGHRIGVGSLTAAMLVAWLVNNLTPVRIGDGVKGYLVARRHALPFSGVLGTVALEHGLDAPSMAVTTAVMAIAVGLSGPWRTASLVAGAAGLAILVVLFTTGAGWLGGALLRGIAHGPRLISRAAAPLASFGSGFGVAGRRRLAAVALAVGLAASLCDAIVLWLVADALGLSLSPAAAVLIAAAVSLSTVLPGAPGYVGTLELAAVGAASAVGMTGPGALAMALAFHVIQYAPLAVAGILVLVTGGHGVELPSPDQLLASRPALATSEVS